MITILFADFSSHWLRVCISAGNVVSLFKLFVLDKTFDFWTVFHFCQLKDLESIILVNNTDQNPFFFNFNLFYRLESLIEQRQLRTKIINLNSTLWVFILISKKEFRDDDNVVLKEFHNSFISFQLVTKTFNLILFLKAFDFMLTTFLILCNIIKDNLSISITIYWATIIYDSLIVFKYRVIICFQSDVFVNYDLSLADDIHVVDSSFFVNK